jgi:hypothetical protein
MNIDTQLCLQSFKKTEYIKTSVKLNVKYKIFKYMFTCRLSLLPISGSLVKKRKKSKEGL